MRETAITFRNRNDSFKGRLVSPTKRTECVVIVAPGFAVDVNYLHGEGKLLNDLSKMLAERGIATLLFNYRFVTPDLKKFRKASMSSEISDLKVTIKEMRKRFRNVGLLGASVGGLVAASAYSHDIDCMAFWYVPTATKMSTPSRRDRYKKHREGYRGYTRLKNINYIIGRQFAYERNTFRASPVFRRLDCPVLVVQGDADKRASLRDANKILGFVKGEKLLHVIHGGDHGFKTQDGKSIVKSHAKQALRATARWFETSFG
ncbi:MAG: hypothetical protein KGI04_03460 [Candidatus Micrarchaeota archaeon]|nr:hypothetical protein [Candidatus Micrarchaeota archaeon]